VYKRQLLYVNQHLMQERHYIPSVSNNAPSPTCSIERKSGARKRQMESLSLTFEQLQKTVNQQIALGNGPAPSSEPNLRSALAAFLEERGIQQCEVIGSTLRASYYRNVASHIESLVGLQRNSAYIRNRKAHLGRWRKFLLEIDRTSANEIRQTPLQIALGELFCGGPPMVQIAAACLIPLSHLKRWRAGHLPKPRSIRWLRVLERHYGLTAGVLMDLVPHTKGGVIHRATFVSAKSKYRERLTKAQAEMPYAVREPCESLREEWSGLLLHKTAVRPPRGLLRQLKGRWSGTVEPVVNNARQNWAAFTNGRYHTTAQITWTHVTYYLGWLQLSADRDGPGITAEKAQTLGALTDEINIERYNSWRINRSGGIMHGGCVAFLKTVQMLCNPTTGYLTQSWQTFAPRCGIYDEASWRERCAAAFRCAADIRRELQPEVKVSRNPFDSMSSAFNLANPLEAVADAIGRMDANRPLTGGISEALWARDRLLLKLLASNPLRAKNIRLLTCLPDNSGQLRKEDGVWRIKLSASDFKNFRGAAKDRSYDMPVRKEVWSDIERYLKHYRPQLATSENQYFLVCSSRTGKPWYSLNRHFASITRRYFIGCPGAGPHIMRHIVATAILKQQPNAWAVAAWALHDKEDTVRLAYTHLESNDAARWLDPMLSAAFSRM
jgi:site-specific recombinase XerC